MNDTHEPQAPGERPLTILAGSRGAGRCRDCRNRVIWVTTSPKGKSVPFDSEPLVLRAFENDRGVRFEVVEREGIHFGTCPAKQPRHPVQRAWSARHAS